MPLHTLLVSTRVRGGVGELNVDSTISISQYLKVFATLRMQHDASNADLVGRRRIMQHPAPHFLHVKKPSTDIARTPDTSSRSC